MLIHPHDAALDDDEWRDPLLNHFQPGEARAHLLRRHKRGEVQRGESA